MSLLWYNTGSVQAETMGLGGESAVFLSQSLPLGNLLEQCLERKKKILLLVRLPLPSVPVAAWEGPRACKWLKKPLWLRRKTIFLIQFTWFELKGRCSERGWLLLWQLPILLLTQASLPLAQGRSWSKAGPATTRDPGKATALPLHSLAGNTFMRKDLPQPKYSMNGGKERY